MSFMFYVTDFLLGTEIESMDSSVDLFFFPQHVRLNLDLFWMGVPREETLFCPKKIGCLEWLGNLYCDFFLIVAVEGSL